MVNILIVSGALIHVKACPGFYRRKRLTIVKEGEKTGVEAVCGLRGALQGVGFQDPQHFCDRLGVLMRAVT